MTATYEISVLHLDFDFKDTCRTAELDTCLSSEADTR